MSSIGIVVGNPKPRSRTRTVAEAVGKAAAEVVGWTDSERVVVDLADLGARLFDWSNSDVRAAMEAIGRCGIAVVASPIYKAAYTGLLKSFLDWFSTTGLSGVTVIPVMVGAGPHHALAVEVHLRPVLVEIGATVPTRGFFVLEDQLSELSEAVEAFMGAEAARLRASVGEK